MKTYYNENDPSAAAWLRELMKRGHIADGVVDDRSIADVDGGDLRGFGRAHFFAGIGGWDQARQYAEWDAPLWTGSCPCQPFSAAGKQRGTADERHLWPEFYRLIAECRPPTIFGEQVASRLGREWLAGVRADLEDVGYAVGAADLCAAGVGAPHIRQRLFYVATSSNLGGVGYAENIGRHAIGNHFDAPQRGKRKTRTSMPDTGGVADSAGEQVGRTGQSWEDSVWIECSDGKARRVEPGVFPLAYGVPARVGRLRGYGNAIVPQVAAQFMMACR